MTAKVRKDSTDSDGSGVRSFLITDPYQPDNQIIYANQAFLELTGYSADEVLGRNCRFLQGPLNDPETVRALHEAIAAKTDISVDIVNYRKNGSPFWNHLVIRAVRDEDGKLLNFIGVQHRSDGPVIG